MNEDKMNYVFSFRRSGNHFLIESIRHNFKAGLFNVEHYHPSRYVETMQGAGMMFYMQRNVYDVLRSLYGMQWADKRRPVYFKDWLRRGMVEAWVEHVEVWKAVDNLYHVAYEDLDENYTKVLRGIEEYFELSRKHSRIKRVPEFVGLSPRSRSLAPEYDEEDIAYIEGVLDG